MSIAINSYGSVDEVAALTKRYTTAGAYTATTNPTLTMVEKFIDRLSARLNVLMANAGFVTPVTQADAKLVLDDFVSTEVVDYVAWCNSSGRFMNTKRLRGKTPAMVVDAEAQEFIDANADGFEALGVVRVSRTQGGSGFVSIRMIPPNRIPSVEFP